jgi:uncharacterized protein (TIGR02271 family)
MENPDATTEIGRLPLVEEVAQITRRRRVSGRVRVAVTTAEESEALAATLRRRQAEVVRVPVNREVEAPPPVRQEGDEVVIPVLEERLVLVRQLVVVEELRIRLRAEEEEVSVPVTRRRQTVAVERIAASDITQNSISAEETTMTQRTLIAMFDSRSEADRAAEALRGLNVSASNVQVHDSGSAGATSAAGQDDDRGNYSSVGSMWMPEEDRATYHEGLRRGGAVLTAEVAEGDMELAMDAMEAAGAVDLDAREQEWRSQGWAGTTATGASGATTGAATGAMLGASSDGSRTGLSATTGTATGTSSNPPGTMASRGVDQLAGTNISGAHPENEHARAAGTTGAARVEGSATTATGATGREESIPIAEERLRVGKRMAHGGRVRVRSYVVETPVEEQVRLREEHVHVERHAVDRPATGTEAELFRDRVIEAEESVEEAVVQKDVRVTGEVVVNKETTERTETVRDTVRRTEVDVDENATANDRTTRGGRGVA